MFECLSSICFCHFFLYTFGDIFCSECVPHLSPFVHVSISYVISIRAAGGGCVSGMIDLCVFDLLFIVIHSLAFHCSHIQSWYSNLVQVNPQFSKTEGGLLRKLIIPREWLLHVYKCVFYIYKFAQNFYKKYIVLNTDIFL